LNIQSKFTFPHPLQIIYFLSQICVHTWNNHSQWLGLITNMWTLLSWSSYFRNWSFMVLVVHIWNCYLNACLNGCWIITFTCSSFKVQFSNTNTKQICECFDLIHCTNSSFLWLDQ
jgi:hypothetical protein